MILSSRELPNQIFDLCVIGSGPAGIIVALEFSRRCPGKRILLLEYGNRNDSPRNDLDDSIENLNALNHHGAYECTNKGLGGTSATWGGRCVMYDPVDFLDRATLRGECTWDENFLHNTAPYTGIAASYFDCGRPAFSTDSLMGCKYGAIAEGFRGGDVTDSGWERWSLPTRFGSRYRAQLEHQTNLFVVMGIEAQEISRMGSGAHDTQLTISDRESRRELRIQAGNFVIAAGAQESTRILLKSSGLFDSIGGPPQALGRYYQGHISGKIASVQFYGDPKKTDYGFRRDTDGTYIRRRFQFSQEAIVREELLNTAIWLDNPLYHDPGHRDGAMSLMYLAMITPFLRERLAPPAIAASVTKGKVNRVGSHLMNIIRGFPRSLAVPASIFLRRYCLKRKLPGIFLFNSRNRYALHFHAEQVPNSESRMLLGADGKSLIINYQISDTDIDSVIRSHELLDRWLRNCGCGHLEFWSGRDELPAAIRSMSKDGIHQSGTTRISNSPSMGVVDRSLRVWGTDNVFVCSSSVFPTSSQANPTFFLGVLAARLADQLSQSDALC